METHIFWSKVFLLSAVQDVKTLKLTPNQAPSSVSATSTNASTDRAKFVCPLNLKEMNGVQPFVFIETCGCVMSQAGMKAVTIVSPSTPPADSEEGKEELDVCPQCATKYDKRRDVRIINPDKETEEKMREEMEARRALERPKKSKKRKADAAEDKQSTDNADAPRKARRTSPPAPAHAPSMNPSIAAASRAVVSSLAMGDAKRKANMSDAVKSLYESKNKNRKETFMTRGTFTRVCVSIIPRQTSN